MVAATLTGAQVAAACYQERVGLRRRGGRAEALIGLEWSGFTQGVQSFEISQEQPTADLAHIRDRASEP